MKKKILIVDDAQALSQILAEVLEMEGYSVTVINDPDKAMSQLDTSPPDLLIIDLVMPKVTGFEIIRQIRDNDTLKGLPVIAVSADSSKERQTEGLASGADAFLSKPFDEDLLLKKISSLIERYARCQR